MVTTICRKILLLEDFHVSPLKVFEILGGGALTYKDWKLLKHGFPNQDTDFTKIFEIANRKFYLKFQWNHFWVPSKYFFEILQKRDAFYYES